MKPAAPPLVPRSDALPDDVRDGIVTIAGMLANTAVIATVLAVVIGAVMIGFGYALKRPGMAVRGWQSVGGACLAAIVAVGLNSWIAWIGGEALSIWN